MTPGTGHDIIPDEIWEGPLDEFLAFVRKLDLPYWACKSIIFEYARYHEITLKPEQVEQTCPGEITLHG
jgi:hypothetical protein